MSTKNNLKKNFDAGNSLKHDNFQKASNPCFSEFISFLRRDF